MKRSNRVTKEQPVPHQPKEQVLVFPAETIDVFYKDFKDNGGVLNHAELVNMILDEVFRRGNLHYMDRAAAEGDPSFKQVIPYTVLMRGRMVFRYQRTKKGGESRLHDKWSVGVGGHINPCDGEIMPDTDLGDVYSKAFERELSEEVSLKDAKVLAPILGLLYDDSDMVGQVHFGVVHALMLGATTALEFKDPALANGEFLHIIDLKQSNDTFENWSKLTIQKLL